MCQTCVDACQEVFPEVPEAEMGNFLWGTTCFPFDYPEMVRKQLVKNRQRMKTDDFRECYAIADRDVEEAMNNPKFTTTDTRECEIDTSARRTTEPV